MSNKHQTKVFRDFLANATAIFVKPKTLKRKMPFGPQRRNGFVSPNKHPKKEQKPSSRKPGNCSLDRKEPALLNHEEKSSEEEAGTVLPSEDNAQETDIDILKVAYEKEIGDVCDTAETESHNENENSQENDTEACDFNFEEENDDDDNSIAETYLPKKRNIRHHGDNKRIYSSDENIRNTVLQVQNDSDRVDGVKNEDDAGAWTFRQPQPQPWTPEDAIWSQALPMPVPTHAPASRPFSVSCCRDVGCKWQFYPNSLVHFPGEGGHCATSIPWWCFRNRNFSFTDYIPDILDEVNSDRLHGAAMENNSRNSQLISFPSLDLSLATCYVPVKPVSELEKFILTELESGFGPWTEHRELPVLQIEDDFELAAALPSFSSTFLS